MTQGIEKMMNFVMITVHPQNTVNLDVSETGVKTLLHTASIEIGSIRKHLVSSLFNLQEQNELASLVQNYQSVIIKLLNDLFSYQCQTNNSDLINLYTSLIDRIAELLTYIETYFYKYFDIDAKIPEIYYSAYGEEIKQQLMELRTQFKEKSTNLELIEIITSNYQPPRKSLNKKIITYRDLIYRKELFRELNLLVFNSSIYNSVKDVLLYLNFNHIEFFKYLVDNLQKECNKLETPEAKLELLKYQRKQFRQMSLQTAFALFSDITHVKEQVLNWIEEEIFFMEGQIQPVGEKLEKGIEPAAESKITVALSVAQLGVFIRVLTLGQVITNNNQLDVIKIFASNFKTYRTEDISYGSLYGKYYKPEVSAIKEVKGTLLQLVGLITKMKD